MDEFGEEFDASFWAMRQMDAPDYLPSGGAVRVFQTREDRSFGHKDFGYHPKVLRG